MFGQVVEALSLLFCDIYQHQNDKFRPLQRNKKHFKLNYGGAKSMHLHQGKQIKFHFRKFQITQPNDEVNLY